MLISGTYLERFFYNILPYAILNSFIVYFLLRSKEEDFSLHFYLLFCTGFTFFIWIVDSIKIHLKKFKKLRISDALYFDNQEIQPSNIIAIKKIKRIGRWWPVKFIEFTIKENNDTYTLSTLEKSVTLLQSYNRVSRTLNLLFDRFPELQKKLVLN